MMNDSQILLAVPTRGQMHWCHVRRLLELQEKHPDVLLHIENGNLSVSHVRNAIVTQFLKSDCEVLLQIDDDVIPPMGIIDMAKSVTEQEPVVAGPYHVLRPEVNIPFPCVYERKDGRFHMIPNPWRTGRVNCDGVGTGAMAIHRSLLERKEMEAPFHMAYRDNGTMSTSDDLAFCSRVRDLGMPIIADYRCFSDHMVEVSMQIVSEGFARGYTQARVKESQKNLVTLA